MRVNRYEGIVLDLADFENLALPKTIKQGFEELLSRESDEVKMDELFRIFRGWFDEEKRPIVLIIDEADSAPNKYEYLQCCVITKYIINDKQKIWGAI